MSAHAADLGVVVGLVEEHDRHATQEGHIGGCDWFCQAQSNSTRSRSHAANSCSDLASSNRQHCLFGVVDIRWVRRPPTRVEVNEDDKCSPSSPLDTVGQRMVAGQPPAQNRCIVDDVRIELLAAELGHRGVESRIRQFYAARCPQCLRGCAGNLLGEPQVLRQADVLVQRAKRSRSSLSRSNSRLARAMNSSSAFTR